jgi:hypothetical protein
MLFLLKSAENDDLFWHTSCLRIHMKHKGFVTFQKIGSNI